MGDIPFSLGGTSSGAFRRVESALENLEAHVGIGVVTVVGSLDTGSFEIGRHIIASRRENARVYIAVRACDDCLKLVERRAGIACVVFDNGTAPEDAFNICGGRRIRTGCIIGILEGSTLEENVEALAPISFVALRSTGRGIVGTQQSIAKVSMSIATRMQIGVGLDIAGRSFSIFGTGSELRELEKGRRSIWIRGRSSTGCLGGTRSLHQVEALMPFGDRVGNHRSCEGDSKDDWKHVMGCEGWIR